MSLYDDATLICLAKGAAGKDGKLYNIKPELEVYPEELTTNGDFATPGTATTSSWSLGWAVSVSSEGDAVISGGKLTLTNAGSEDRADAYMTDGSSAFFDLIEGETYYVTYNVTDNSDGAASVLRVYAGSTNSYVASTDLGPQSVVVTQSGSDESLIFQMKSTDASLTISNISVKRVKQAPLDFTFTRGSNLTATRVAPSGYIEKGRENLLLYSNDFSNSYWTKVDSADGGGTTVTSGQSGYDGSTNAWLLSKTEQEFGGIDRSISNTGVKTFSVYAKSGTVDHMRLFAADTTYAYFDLSGNGSVGSKSGEIEAKIEKVSSSWFRCSVATSGSTSVVKINPAIGDGDLGTDTDEGGTGTGSIYIQNAQLEAGLVATDYIESGSTTGKAGILEDSPRFDYTGGGCPTWLGEPNRDNLIQYSEYFSGWPTISNVTLTDNDAKSPEGLNNATKLLASGSGAVNHQVDSNSFDITAGGGAVTASIFAKKGNTDFVRLRLNGTTSGSNTGSRAWFDLENGEVGEVDDDATATITDMGDGWYRCTITEAGNTNDTSLRLQVFINESDGQTSWTADGDEYIYIYGAQFEEGSYATSYIPNHGLSGGATRNVEQTDVSNLQSNGIITDTQGTFFIDVDDYSTTAVQWGILNSDFYFGLRAAFFSSTMTVYQRILNTQTSIRNINSGDVASLATTTRRKLALSWNGTSLITSINGTSFDDTIDSTLASQLDKIRRANWSSTKVSTDQLLMFDKQLTKEELNELTSIS